MINPISKVERLILSRCFLIYPQIRRDMIYGVNRNRQNNVRGFYPESYDAPVGNTGPAYGGERFYFKPSCNCCRTVEEFH